MSNLLRINGVDIPTPSTYQVGIQDISQAERNATGTMIKERIATKVKLELSWKYLSATDLQMLLQKVDDNFISVTYLDPKENKFLTKVFYPGDRTVNALDYRNGKIRWKDIKFNLIER